MTDWNADPEKDLELDRAIRFLAAAMEKSGHNPKPVVLHSVRTGVYLRGLGYSREIVLAGFLHDVIEDSDVKAGDVEALFGKEVRVLVEALTHDSTIKDRWEQYREVVSRIVTAGPSALIVSAADTVDNIPFFRLAGSAELYAHLLEKTGEFLEASEGLIGKERPWQELEAEYRRLPRQWTGR